SCTLCSPLPFFFTTPSSSVISTLSLHDALPILKITLFSSKRFLPWVSMDTISGPNSWTRQVQRVSGMPRSFQFALSISSTVAARSEEHTSELQSRFDLVCRLLLEKKKHI